MWDITLECLRATIIGLILVSVWQIGRRRQLNLHPGWNYVISGWALILFGSLLDITDNFEQLNWLLVIGDTDIESFLEKFVGYLLGYVFLFIGFLSWLPAGAVRVDNMKREFISTVSHELRTPLTAIYGAVRLLESEKLGKLSEKGKNTLSIAIRNTEHLTALVNDILDIEKLELKRMEFEYQQHDIRALMKSIVEDSRFQAEDAEIVLHLNKYSKSGLILVDEKRFQQVMDNLITNAIKHSPAGSSVNINITHVRNWLRVIITDRGSGIPENLQPVVFEKFTQENSSDNRGKEGTGLGLAICKELTEQMQGRIGFTSEPGVGTSFHVDFPEVNSN